MDGLRVTGQLREQLYQWFHTSDRELEGLCVLYAACVQSDHPAMRTSLARFLRLCLYDEEYRQQAERLAASFIPQTAQNLAGSSQDEEEQTYGSAVEF